jgi:hypothetical protein
MELVAELQPARQASRQVYRAGRWIKVKRSAFSRVMDQFG